METGAENFHREHAECIPLTYKDVGRKETVYELYCLKAWQISKDYARSREITNEPYTSLNCENTDKNFKLCTKFHNEELNW